MSLNDYQKAAARTMGRDDKDLSWDDAMGCWGLGVAGEAGEVADYLKKVLYHGKPFDLDHLVKEMGDVLWYLAALATSAGIPLQRVADANIAKLRARYPEWFTHAATRPAAI